MLTTTDLRGGQYVTLEGFGLTDRQYRQKLLALGLVRGVRVWVVRIAPLGCPIEINVSGTLLVLRKDEARYLEWKHE